jgi:hypothetical protein
MPIIPVNILVSGKVILALGPPMVSTVRRVLVSEAVSVGFTVPTTMAFFRVRLVSASCTTALSLLAYAYVGATMEESVPDLARNLERMAVPPESTCVPNRVRASA